MDKKQLEKEIEEQFEIIETQGVNEVQELILLNNIKRYYGEKKNEYKIRYWRFKKW